MGEAEKMVRGRFSGLCVGGPRAGDWVTCHQPTLCAIMPSRVGTWTLDMAALDTPVPFDTMVYRHVVGIRGEVELDLWVPEDRWGGSETAARRWALHEIVSGYRAAALRAQEEGRQQAAQLVRHEPGGGDAQPKLAIVGDAQDALRAQEEGR